MSEDLRQKIIDVVCEEWPTLDGYLLGSDIYERLRRQGVNVTDHTLHNELAELAARGRNGSSGWSARRRPRATPANFGEGAFRTHSGEYRSMFGRYQGKR